MKIQFAFGIALVTLMCGYARSADEAPSASKDIPELAALDAYVGTWESEMTVKNAENPNGIQTKASTVGEWIHDGHFLRQTWSVAASGGQPAINGSSIRTYDPRRKLYRSWNFISTGLAEEAEGAWDADTRTMTWTVRDADSGRTSVHTSTLAEDGVDVWSIVEKDGDGKVLAEVNGKATRSRK